MSHHTVKSRTLDFTVCSLLLLLALAGPGPLHATDLDSDGLDDAWKASHGYNCDSDGLSNALELHTVLSNLH